MVWIYLRILPISVSPDGVVTWGGGVPKASSGHTWCIKFGHFKIFRTNQLPECRPHRSTSCWAYHLLLCLVGKVGTRGDPPRHPQTWRCRRYSAAGFPWWTRSIKKTSFFTIFTSHPSMHLVLNPVWDKRESLYRCGQFDFASSFAKKSVFSPPWGKNIKLCKADDVNSVEKKKIGWKN